MTSSSHLRVIVAAVLTFLLFFLLCGRFAAALPSNPTRKTIQTQSSPAFREGELLVRFRSGVSEHDKDTIVATHGARRKKQLEGDSGLEKLEVSRDLYGVALELLLNPQVEFAE